MKKAGFYLLMIAGLLLAVSAVFCIAGMFQAGTVDDKQFRLILAGLFCAGTVVALLFYFILLAVRRVYSRKKDTSHRSVSNAGSVLLMVLVILAVSAGLLMHLRFTAGALLRKANRQFQSSRLESVLPDTAWNLLQTLADDEDLLTDHRGEEWAQAVEIEYPSGIVAKGAILDEQRLFDANNIVADRPEQSTTLSKQILGDIMRECGFENTAVEVDALEDWVDADEDGEFESELYMKKDVAYQCPDSVIEGLEEVEWIEGWSREMLAVPREEDLVALNECLTAIPVDRREPMRCNVNTARPEVLRALLGGDNEQLVQLILSMREDTPLTSLRLLESALNDNQMERIRPFLDVKSNFFRFFVSAAREGRTARLQGLARRESDGAVQVLRWIY